MRISIKYYLALIISSQCEISSVSRHCSNARKFYIWLEKTFRKMDMRSDTHMQCFFRLCDEILLCWLQTIYLAALEFQLCGSAKSWQSSTFLLSCFYNPGLSMYLTSLNPKCPGLLKSPPYDLVEIEILPSLYTRYCSNMPIFEWLPFHPNTPLAL